MVCMNSHTVRIQHGAPLLLIRSQITMLRPSAIPRHQPFSSRQRHQPKLNCSASYETSSRITEVVLRRPLGITLAEDESGKTIFVEEVVSGGNAEQSGKVHVGDTLLQVSATTLKAGKDGSMKEGYGQRPYDNWESVMFNCEGQDFKTVMAALDSNNPRWGINKVTLVLRKKA